MREYALYKGDELLIIGTLEEIAREYGVKPSTVQYWGTESYKKRNLKNAKILVEIDMEGIA